ncbi:MAG: FtsH protease activity modulator HflK [Micropepsaceae bacterium]
MPWNNQTGGQPGNGGRGPWGGGPSGTQPPDLEELLKKGQEKLRAMLPGGFGRSSALIAVLIVGVVWALSGIYVVQPDQQGVVLRFGEVVARTSSGMNYHLPWPIETVEKPSVTRENQISIGFAPATDGSNQDRQVPQESLMLTGDENIVDINFTVFWIIQDAADYLFNVENPGDPNALLKVATIKAVSEASMREIIGRNVIDTVLTENREMIQDDVRILAQQILDSYGAGVTIQRVQMQKADPPAQVIDAYRDVQAARTDQDRMRNEAEAYANRIVPEARGAAARITEQAEAYKQQVVAEADGEAQRFMFVLNEYQNAPQVTRRRIYLETMQQIFGGMNKVILDTENGVTPYFPLPAITQGGTNVRPGAVPAPAPSAGAIPGASVSITGGQ